MRRFILRLLVMILILAELTALLILLTMSRHIVEIKADKTGKIIDDGIAHILGSVTLPKLEQPEPVPLPEEKEENHPLSPEDSDPEEVEPPEENGDPSEEELSGGEVLPPDEPAIETFGGVPASEYAEDAYFDDVVFIGDSVSLKLQYYVREKRASEGSFLGGAQFLTAGSFSYLNAMKPVSEESVHPSYQGEKMLLEDAVAACGAKKLYIMLGMNDIAGGRYDGTISNLKSIISRILEKSPDVTFYFQSVTPRMEDSQITQLNNEVIRTYNERLLSFCEENGYYYLDVYSVLCDEEGNLPPEYCSDPVETGGMGIHFTNSACAAWIEYLYTHTA